jgi:hypothetical protein
MAPLYSRVTCGRSDIVLSIETNFIVRNLILQIASAIVRHIHNRTSG